MLFMHWSAVCQASPHIKPRSELRLLFINIQSFQTLAWLSVICAYLNKILIKTLRLFLKTHLSLY